MSIELKNVTVVDEDPDALHEIEISFTKPQEEKIIEPDDPFLDKVSPTRKQLNRLEKAYTGQDGTHSKYNDPELLNGYSVWDVVVPPYNLEYLTTMYDENGYLRAAIDARVMNTVGLGYGWEPTLKARTQVEKATDNDDKADRVRKAQQKEKDMLNELFDSFNDEETLMEVLIRAWLDALTTGNGYIEVGRTALGKIGYIGYVPSKYTRVRRRRDGFVQLANSKAVFFRNFGDQVTKDTVASPPDPNPNEMLHFKIHSPNNTYYGIPPSISVLHAIIGDKFAKEFNIDYFENKAIPRYAIILKGVKLSEKSKRELVQYFRNEVKGKNHGTLVVPLPAAINGAQADVKFEKLEADIQDGSFDKYRKSNRDEIVSVYRVPPTKVGIFDNANLAISRDADKTFKSQVVGPDQALIQKRINRIVKEFTDLFTLELESLDVLDEDLRSRIHDRYARIGVETANEIRQEIGKVSIPGGDEPIPFPIKTGFQKGEMWPSKEVFMPPKPAAPGGGTAGAPVGNKNSASGSPEKSGQDNGSNASNKDETGTNAERGQVQEGGT